jgi:hypothetical protein
LRNKTTNSDYFSSVNSIYLSEIDVLIVAGNGAYAIFNATNPNLQNNTIIQVLQVPFQQRLQKIMQVSKTSFAIQYVNPMRYNANGILAIYEVTNSTHIEYISS